MKQKVNLTGITRRLTIKRKESVRNPHEQYYLVSQDLTS